MTLALGAVAEPTFKGGAGGRQAQRCAAGEQTRKGLYFPLENRCLTDFESDR